MKKIKLTKGKYALVDDADYNELMQYKWYSGNTSKFYAFRSKKVGGNWRQLGMHRHIMQPKEGYQVDHIDNNGLNNQRSNLRVCTQAENSRNKGRRSHNTSGYAGVSFHANTKKWKAQIAVDKKHIYIGIYKTAEEAYKAYCEACLKYHGEFANIKNKQI